MRGFVVSLISALLFLGCVTTSESPIESRIYEVNEYSILALETSTQILVRLEQENVTLSVMQAKALAGTVQGLLTMHNSLADLMVECELAGGLESCSKIEYINQAITTTTDLARLVLLLSQEAK